MPDARYDWLVQQYKPKSQVPANLTVYDIAGLTRGSSTGAGLGNAFLSHIRAVDAIFQVVRCFDDAEIIHVEGDVNPTRDLEIIAEELRLKDIEFVEKAKENLSKQTRRGGQSLEMKKLKEEEATVEKILQMLKDGKDVRKADWGPKEVRQTRFPPTITMMNKSYKLYNPSSSTAASLILTLEAAMRESPTLNIYSSTSLTTGATLCTRLTRCSLPDRGHQPSLPPYRQTGRLPHQPLRKGLHPPEEQIPPESHGMAQDQFARRTYPPNICLVRRTSCRYV